MGVAVAVSGTPISVCACWRTSRTCGTSACGGRVRGVLFASDATDPAADSGALEIALTRGGNPEGEASGAIDGETNGTAETRVGGTTDSRAASGFERGAGAMRVTSSLDSSAAPQSVSISSVTGGIDGGMARGCWLAVTRGGTDDACP